MSHAKTKPKRKPKGKTALAPSKCSTALECVVENLSDGYKWNWTRVMSHRDAADAALRLLANEGLIEQADHPLGGQIWRVNGKLFGRTDEITHKKFDELKR